MASLPKGVGMRVSMSMTVLKVMLAVHPENTREDGKKIAESVKRQHEELMTSTIRCEGPAAYLAMQN